MERMQSYTIGQKQISATSIPQEKNESAIENWFPANLLRALLFVVSAFRLGHETLFFGVEIFRLNVCNKLRT